MPMTPTSLGLRMLKEPFEPDFDCPLCKLWFHEGT
jgi:hypothetical protein